LYYVHVAEDLLLGIDVGTQSARAALMTPQGATVAMGSAKIASDYPHPGWAEQRPSDWWNAIALAVQTSLKGIDPARVKAIGLDATACTVVACADDGTPLRPALLWADQRAVKEAEELSASGDPNLAYIGGRLSPEWMLPKALWLARHAPDDFARAARVVECTDWLMHRLTGAWTLSLNNVTVKWDYARGWPAKMLAMVPGLREKWPAKVLPLGAPAGELVTDELGLKKGTLVAQGGIDAYLGMIGLGATAPGDVAIITGSSTCHLAQSKEGVFDSGAAGCYPDAIVVGEHTIEAGQTATGSILSWFKEKIGHGATWEALDAEASAIPAGAEGLVVREDWQGNRSPFKNGRARGAITGLSLHHGPAHILRAIYEATSLGTRAILDDLAAHGLVEKRIVLGGGGARSKLWLQIQADVLGRPIQLTDEPESCALGSAIVAAVAAGVFPDLGAAARSMVQLERTVEPSGQSYDELYAAYQDLYRKLNS
jgi:ribulokinase